MRCACLSHGFCRAGAFPGLHGVCCILFENVLAGVACCVLHVCHVRPRPIVGSRVLGSTQQYLEVDAERGDAEERPRHVHEPPLEAAARLHPHGAIR